jgi:4-hydroxyphenylpyruvate dioxygenase
MSWPSVDRTRGAGEALLPGITSPADVHLFLSAGAGEPDHWRDDFDRVPASEGRADPVGWLGIDHVGVAVPPERLNEEIGFLRSVFGLVPGPAQEFWETQGRLRSRALRPPDGAARLVVNVEEGAGVARSAGINQVAFACTDLLAEVRRLRERGVALVEVPDNYYVDLAGRFPLSPSRVQELREHRVLYDRVGDGELLHVYTDVLSTGFYVELLERRGGYDGYGSANTAVRLAVQRRST